MGATIDLLTMLLLLLPPSTLAQTAPTPPIMASNETGFTPCDALISAGLGNRLLFASSDAYESRIESWWNANARLHPWCILQPQNSQEVSTAMVALNGVDGEAGDWHIAVRSGGHSQRGTNSIDNGVTIDLGMMNRSSFDAAQNIASVEPGGHWKDVYHDLLSEYNVTVTGGRDGGVGVGGFLLGGGLSFYTGRNGLGCDTVVNHEVVLANGSIVNANAQENSDLWKALKGGGANFGIVTRFDMRAMPAIDIAYGESVISADYSDDVVDAIIDFTSSLDGPTDDAYFMLYMFDTTVSEDTTITFTPTNVQGDLNTTSFDNFTAIPTVLNETPWGLTSLAEEANNSQLAGGTKNLGFTLTFSNDRPTLAKSVELFNDLVSTLSASLGPDNFTVLMIIQSLSPHLGTIGQQNGGNMLGLEETPALLWDFGVTVPDGAGSDAALALAMAETSAMTAKLKAFSVDQGTDMDLVYMNYAEVTQNVIGSYGVENVEYMRQVAKRYDPEGWFQTMVPGGFKLGEI